MKKQMTFLTMLAALVVLVTVSARADIIPYESNVDYSGYIKHDRFLNVEIWTDDDEYYQGDNMNISFRADQDCFVAIYNIDTRGRVNLLFPYGQQDEGWIEGGRTYQIPDGNDDFDLTVRGPEGEEFLQIVASRRPFPIPNWYGGTGLICDDDPYDFMNYVNVSYFGCEGNCKQAFDVTSFGVREWHDYYFRPVYVYDHHHDWDWGLYGSVYIDYPFGATIYIDGVYWGIAPLFLPRIYYGWHYITLYDHYGHCWEDEVHVIKHKSIVLDNTIIRPRPDIKSRFKDVRAKAYLDPIKNGYPEFQKEVRTKQNLKPVASKVESGTRYKVADEKAARETYSAKSRNTERTTVKSRTGDYESKRSSGNTKSTFGTSGKRERWTPKSESESKETKSYDTHKSSGEKREIKSEDQGKSGRSSTYDRPTRERNSDSGNKSTRSIGRSERVKKSSETTASSKPAPSPKSGDQSNNVERKKK